MKISRGTGNCNFRRLRRLRSSASQQTEVLVDLQVATPGVPWADIIGMRNRLIHAYDDVNLSVVWQTVTSDLPPLVIQLEQILAMEPEI